MKFLLDTNTCIRYLNGRAPAVRDHLHRYPARDVAVCSVVKAELYFGAMKSANPDKTLAGQNKFLSQYVSLPFDDRAASEYGRVRARLSAQGTMIGPNDVLIASIALANDVILVTHNTREFSRITDLKLEDWETEPENEQPERE